MTMGDSQDTNGAQVRDNGVLGRVRPVDGTGLSSTGVGPSKPGRGGARFWVLAFALLLLNGLGWFWNSGDVQASNPIAKDSVRVLRIEPAADLDKASELKLIFDRPMVQPERVGQALSKSPFGLQPAAEGRWRWSTPTELTFEMAEPLPQGHTYKITASPEFSALTGFDLIGEHSFERQTQALNIDEAVLVASEPGVLSIRFEFNQPVAPSDLRAALKVENGRLEIDQWNVLSKEPADKLLVRIPYSTVQTPKHLILSIDEALHGHGADVGLNKARVFSVKVPQGFTSTGVRAWPSSSGNTCSVTIRFSESLALGQEVPSLTFSPAIKHTEAHIRGSTLRLSGEFECDQSYVLQIGEALLSSSGSTLGEKEPLTFKVPARPRDITMPEGNGLLMPDGQLELGLRATNVQTLEVSTSRLHANNLVSHLHHNGTSETSRKEKPKRFELNLKPNAVTDCSLSLRELVDEPLGVYRVYVRDVESRWNSDYSLVRVSDMALTAKREKGGLFVWVTSLKTGNPLEGVALEARSHNNQILGSARSSASGVAHIVYPEDLPDGGIFVVSATLGRDFAYLQPDKNTWVFDKVNTAGKSFAKDVDAWLYTESGVYRPGETMHLTGVLRAPDGGFTEQRPYEVRLRRPDGRIDWRGPLTGEAALDSQGMFQIAMPTRRTSPTGLHTIDLWDMDADESRGQIKVNVENFVPVRLEVGALASVLEAEPGIPVEASAAKGSAPQARAPRNLLKTPEPRALSSFRRIAVDVDSRDFLGRPSKGLTLQVLPHWKRQQFRSEAFPEFSFAEPKSVADRKFQGRLQKRNLDDEGRARVELIPGSNAPGGLWQLRAAATVTETGGRSATRTVTSELDTATHHLGFRLPTGRAPVGEAMVIDWQLVDPKDALSAPVAYTVRLEQIVHEYGMQQVNGRLTWQHKERHVDVQRFTIGESNASGTLHFNLLAPGSYRLLAEEVEGSGQALFEFYAGGYNASAGQSDPQLLELTLDRAVYEPGDPVAVQVRGEFSGQLLVTLENDRVLHSQVIEFQTPMTEVSLSLPENLRGGAFISASLIRGVDPSQTSWLPHRARGLVRVKTDHPDHVLALALEAPKRLAPGQKVTIHATSLSKVNSIQVEAIPGILEATAPKAQNSGRPARLHVWAVDTGILLATDEKLPDPHAHFFAQHRRGVGTADSWAHLLPDHMRAASILRIGGDTDADKAMARRLAALPPTERKSGVAWSYAVDLNPDRTADIELELPDIRGAVTLRAILVEGDSYASFEQRIELATDLQITASWPRYSTAGDKFRVPVKLLNTTDGPMQVSLEAELQGPMSFAAEGPTAPVSLAPDEEKTVWYLAETSEPGLAQVTVFAVGDHGTESTSTEFQVRPATALHQETSLARIQPGQAETFDVAANFEARGLRVNVEISGQSQVELRPALRALIDYPHGCLEQTTSRLFALVNAGALLDNPEGGDESLVHTMVMAGIYRLHAMQTRSGGFSYWMGGTSPSSWGSAYAASFLVEAKRAGFEVPSTMSGPLMEYLTKRLRSGDEELATQALMCRVLAAFGKPHEGWMARIQEDMDKLDLAGRAHLAAAWLQLGRRDRAMECLGEDTLTLACRSSASGRFTSQIRQEGVLLSVLIDLDPNHDWVPVLAQRLYKARANGRWRSTLEDAAALSALARYQTLQPNMGAFTGALIAASGERFEFDSSEATQFVFEKGELQGQPFSIEVAGDARAFLIIDAEGSPTAPVAAYDKNLVVRRKWLDVNGEVIDASSKLRVGDLVQVELEVSTEGLAVGQRLANVAIVDALPAGLEIENPRLANTIVYDYEESAEADRVEFLEDRVVIFATAHSERVVFRYTLRATLAGDYVVPPIQASSMYEPGFASLGAPSTLRVVRQ